MSIYRLGEVQPRIHPQAFIHPDAVLIGAVTIAAQASIWPGAVLRADFGRIVIGARTSIQDGTVLHTSAQWPTVIGSDCVVGHNAHLEGVVIEDRCLIGSMSTCLQRVVVEHDSLIGAAALLVEGTRVPSGSRALGAPAKIAQHPDGARFAAALRDGVDEYLRNAAHFAQCMRRVG